MKLTPSRIRLLQSLANSGTGILWDNLGGVGKTTSAYLQAHKLAELQEVSGGTLQPTLLKLRITDLGRAAISP